MSKLLSMKNINKSFFGVKVLKDVNFDLNSGEVHVLLGENGAGKTTLIKILSGAYTLDSGEILIENKRIDTHSYTPKDAYDQGVVTIYQNYHLVPHFSVAENIALSNFPGYYGMVNWKNIFHNAQEVLQNISFSINPKLQVRDLSVSEKQMLEIAIALSKNAKIIIMDEPTAAISKKETEILFQVIHELKKKGIGIVYISHKLEELRKIGNRITILRDGYNVGTLDLTGIDLHKVVRLMTGREIRRTKKSRDFLQQETFAEFRQLSSPDSFKDINFTIKKGEILGLTGLVGSGKTELARAIFSIDRLTEGEIYINTNKVQFNSPRDAIRFGIGYLPEDRDVDGLCLNMPLKDNISLVLLSKLKTWFFNTRKEKTLVNGYVNHLGIKASNIFQYVKYLSGGNKQKVIFAKWLAADCQFLILDEPTVGIDVGAREEIYELIHDFVKDYKKSLLFISSDIDEILKIADRILIMAGGVIVTEVDPKETNKRCIMEYCLLEQ